MSIFSKKILVITIGVFFYSSIVYSQMFKHELGGFIGAVSIQSDYGQRGDFPSTYGNVGFGVGASYYFSFNDLRRRWNDRASYAKNHFRLKAEFSYMKDEFKHRGDYVNGLSTSTIKMAAMKGSTQIMNIGGQLEITVFELDSNRNWNPYFSAGAQYVFFNPDISSSLGDWKDNPTLIPEVYLDDGIYLQNSKTQSFSFGAGTRYYVGNFELVFDFRWQRFLSDNIEGLSPKIDANKYRDWLIFANVGAVFKLN